jgi:hypothetical protein
MPSITNAATRLPPRMAHGWSVSSSHEPRIIMAAKTESSTAPARGGTDLRGAIASGAGVGPYLSCRSGRIPRRTGSSSGPRARSRRPPSARARSAGRAPADMWDRCRSSAGSGGRPPRVKLGSVARGAPREAPPSSSPAGHFLTGAPAGPGAEPPSWLDGAPGAGRSGVAAGPRRVLSKRLRTLATRRRMSCRSTVVASVGRLLFLFFPWLRRIPIGASQSRLRIPGGYWTLVHGTLPHARR